MKLLLPILGLFLASCPGSGGAGMIHRDAIRPSVDAITLKFDELVDGAVNRGDMHPIEGQTWHGETLLLRHLVSEDPSPAVVASPDNGE